MARNRQRATADRPPVTVGVIGDDIRPDSGVDAAALLGIDTTGASLIRPDDLSRAIDQPRECRGPRASLRRSRHRPSASSCITAMSDDRLAALERHVADLEDLRVRFESHGCAFLRMRLPPMATRIIVCETSMRFS